MTDSSPSQFSAINRAAVLHSNIALAVAAVACTAVFAVTHARLDDDFGVRRAESEPDLRVVPASVEDEPSAPVEVELDTAIVNAQMQPHRQKLLRCIGVSSTPVDLSLRISAEGHIENAEIHGLEGRPRMQQCIRTALHEVAFLPKPGSNFTASYELRSETRGKRSSSSSGRSQ